MFKRNVYVARLPAALVGADRVLRLVGLVAAACLAWWKACISVPRLPAYLQDEGFVAHNLEVVPYWNLSREVSKSQIRFAPRADAELPPRQLDFERLSGQGAKVHAFWGVLALGICQLTHLTNMLDAS